MCGAPELGGRQLGHNGPTRPRRSSIAIQDHPFGLEVVKDAIEAQEPGSKHPMNSAPMPSLPISFVTALAALVIAGMILRSSTGTRLSRTCFASLFGVFSLQALLVGLRFGYGIEVLAPFQRALPFAAGPLVYLGFRALADPAIAFWRTARVHLGFALLAIGAIWMSPVLFDVGALPSLARHGVDLLITLSFLVYLTLLVRLHRRGPDAFEAAAFNGVFRARRWLLAAILLLLGNLVLDSVIAIDFAVAEGRRAAALIGWGSVSVIATLLAAAIFYPRGDGLARRRPGTSGAPDGSEVDRALLARIDRLLSTTALHHDPDLSLSRLSRRLGEPARRVSEAINRQCGVNVSQYINARRVEEAAEQLASSDRPVGEIMQSVGFRTKSNFNREFRRLKGHSPGEHRSKRDQTRAKERQVAST